MIYLKNQDLRELIWGTQPDLWLWLTDQVNAWLAESCSLAAWIIHCRRVPACADWLNIPPINIAHSY
jgi:hypothetical protein